LSLLKLLRRGVPLPFASVSNRRSLVAVENLAAVLEHCVSRAAAANQVFLAADGEDLSTPELLRRLSRAMGKEARLFPVPSGVLLAAAALAGRRDVARRLLGNLQVDARKTRERLGWQPVIAVDQALQNTARAFLASESS
jgi:nucleoside-diphosphate-sugar epimerase